MLISERTVLEDVIEGPTIQAEGYVMYAPYVVSTHYRPANIKNWLQ